MAPLPPVEEAWLDQYLNFGGDGQNEPVVYQILNQPAPAQEVQTASPPAAPRRPKPKARSRSNTAPKKLNFDCEAECTKEPPRPGKTRKHSPSPDTLPLKKRPRAAAANTSAPPPTCVPDCSSEAMCVKKMSNNTFQPMNAEEAVRQIESMVFDFNQQREFLVALGWEGRDEGRDGLTEHDKIMSDVRSIMAQVGTHTWAEEREARVRARILSVTQKISLSPAEKLCRINNLIEHGSRARCCHYCANDRPVMVPPNNPFPPPMYSSTPIPPPSSAPLAAPTDNSNYEALLRDINFDEF